MKKQTLVLVTILLGIVYSCTNSHSSENILKSIDESSIFIFKDYEVGEYKWYIENPKDSVKLYLF